MERCLFLKNVKGLLSVRVSESIYGEIIRYVEDSGQQITEELLMKEDVGQLDSYLQNITNGGEKVDSIFVKDRDYFRRIEFKRIRWVEASGSYCCLNLEAAPKIMLSFNLRELSNHLSSSCFLRVHRSYIVNINFIDSFIGNMLCLGKEQIPVSRQHKANVIARLNILGNVK